jgi:hypothetical protein
LRDILDIKHIPFYFALQATKGTEATKGLKGLKWLRARKSSDGLHLKQRYMHEPFLFEYFSILLVKCISARTGLYGEKGKAFISL